MDFLNYTDWQDTADTLHMLLQMSGKVKLLYRAKRPEWAHIRQYLTLDGISTGIVPEAPVPFEINFDFREDQVVFRNYNGKTEKVALEDGKSVGDYYRQFMAALKQIDVPARIDVKSQEFYDPVDLDKDGKHRSYQKEAVLLWLDNMLFADSCPGCCRHLQRPVICLRTAGGKINFLRPRMQQMRDFLPRCLDCVPRCPPLFIQGGRVAEVFCHPGQHRLQGCFTQAGGCSLIRIYAHVRHPFHFRRSVNTSHPADPGSIRWKDIRL